MNIATLALSSAASPPIRSGAPSSVAPSPRAALKSSPRSGSCTAQASGPSASSSATAEHQTGTPRA
jgi:hypothetical protein